MSASLLHGLRIVDLTDMRGALAGRMLADLGADVVRVEPPEARSAHQSAEHAFRNAGKSLVVADVDTAEGRASVMELAQRADVLVDNLGPARRADIGVAAWAPEHLIQLAISDMGATGPRADWHLEPLPALAASGALHLSGFPDLPPCSLPGFLAHDCASGIGATGVVAALLDRRRTGRGQVIDVSVQEAALSGLIPWSVAVEDYLQVNPHFPAAGNRNADGYYFVLPASDGHVRVVIGNPKHWRGLVELLGNPDALTGDEWADRNFRNQNIDVFRMVAEDCMTDRTRVQLAGEAQAVGTPMGIVHTPLEFMRHEQTRVRNFFRDFDGDAIAGAPYNVADSPSGPLTPAPVAEQIPQWDETRPWASREGARSGDGQLLEGLRVVEFGVAAVIPELDYILTELGADVIKIESHAHLDVLRLSGGARINHGFAFNAECRGRRSVALDLRTERGRELALQLCAQADIVTENHRGGALAKLGLDEAAVRAVNPNVIYVSSQGYGQGGPMAQMPAFGPVNSGFSGVHHLWNHPDAPYPCGVSLNHPDHIAGKTLAGPVLAALARRDLTGSGASIEMAQTEMAAYLLGHIYTQAHRDQVDPLPVGNASAHCSPHGVYPTAGDDRWIALACPDDQSWERLVATIDQTPPPEWHSMEGRLEHRSEVDAWVALFTSDHEAAALSEILQASRVSAMAVQGPVDHHRDEHLAERDFIVTLQHPELGPERHVGNPLRFAAMDTRVAQSAPALGAHTAEVLGELLSLSAADCTALIESGICH